MESSVQSTLPAAAVGEAGHSGETLHPATPSLMDRHCAHCDVMIPADRVKLCGKCHRRAYCSRECQAMDWKTKKVDVDGRGSQGHKSWCGLEYGEQDLDWIVADKQGPSSSYTHGKCIIANRFFPAKTRIMVDSYKNIQYKSSGDIILDSSVIRQLILHSKYVAHSCNGNAGKEILCGEGLNAAVIYSKRDIQPGEEITANIMTYNDGFEGKVDPDTMNRMKPGMYAGSLDTFADCRRILERHYKVFCPSDCFCRNEDMDKLIANGRTVFEMISDEEELSSKPSRKLVDRRLATVQELLGILDTIGGSPLGRVVLLRTAWELAVQQRKTVQLGFEYIKEAYEIHSAILHPKCGCVRYTEGLMLYPERYEKYLILEREMK